MEALLAHFEALAYGTALPPKSKIRDLYAEYRIAVLGVEEGIFECEKLIEAIKGIMSNNSGMETAEPFLFEGLRASCRELTQLKKKLKEMLL